MILLILGLLIILVLFYQIYIIKKNEEPFISTASEIQVQNQRDFLNQQDKYYDVRSQGPGAGLLVTKPGINDFYKLDENKNLKKYTQKVGLDRSEIDKNVTNCRALTKCEQLANNKCGYCSTTKEFDFGDNRGPKTDVCPDKMWTTEVNKCKELREKTICSEVKSCGDLYGEAEKLCGYCPTTGTAMVMEKVGDKYMPKYKDDVCGGAGFGLIPGSKCKQFAQDHPCVTPYYLSGPHSGDCVKKLWKNSTCTDPTPYGKTHEDLGKAIKMSYKQAGNIMKQTNEKTRSTEYWEAVNNSVLCYGNSKNIDPCDMKYNKQGIPHPKCLEKIFLDAGGSKKGTGYAAFKINPDGKGSDVRAFYHTKQHVKKVNELSKNSWNIFSQLFQTTTNLEKYKKDLNKIMENIKSADTYQKRYDCSMFMLGEKPPKPEPIKAGDTVNMRLGGKRYEGVAMNLDGNNCDIMWIKLEDNGTITDRNGMPVEKQKEIFGWPGINPTGSSGLKTRYPRFKLNNQKSCSNNKSECKMTCKMIINDMFFRFPKPKDCIVGDWGAWGGCSKKCGGGVQSRSRSVKYPAKFGGKQCPPLVNKRMCNTQPCSSPNFTQQGNSGFYENNKLRVISGRNSWTPPKGRKLKECEADCDRDSDCADGLKCFQRRGNEKVPGCEGSASRGYDYCIPKERFIKNVSVRGRNNPKLGMCEGDCDRDTDCQDGLKCYQRSGSGSVPGCAGNPKRDWDYCVPKVNSGSSYKDIGKQYCVNYKSYKRHYVSGRSWSQKTQKCKEICDNDQNCNAIALGTIRRNNKTYNCTTYSNCNNSGRSTWWTRRGPGYLQFKFYKKQ